jgi:hypothetical protein
MKYIQICFALIVFVLVANSSVAACDCAFGGGEVCQDYWQASAVFVGTVIESHGITVNEGNYSHEERVVRLSLDEGFRGVEGAETEVLTGLGGGDCGFGFRQAQQYLVYAYRSDKDNKLYTSICTRTKSISQANADLVYIHGLNKSKPGATVRGEVMKYLRNEEGNLANQPLAGVKVSLKGERKYETITDAKGRYSIDSIPPGEYTVMVAAPQGLAMRGPEKKISVADRGCAVVTFWLESSAQLSGRVLNPQGLPVPKAEIFMSEADKERYRGHWDAAYSDEEGKYAFKLVPPGRYVLTIRYDGMTSQTRPFPTTYYPGVSDKSQAKVFTIREGQIVDSYDLQVPPMPAEYDVQGTVVWADGKPARGARVGYEVSGESILYGANVDDQGHFSLKAYEGLRFGIGASIEIGKGKYAYSNSASVIVGTSLEPIKLVLTLPSQ